MRANQQTDLLRLSYVLYGAFAYPMPSPTGQVENELFLHIQ